MLPFLAPKRTHTKKHKQAEKRMTENRAIFTTSLILLIKTLVFTGGFEWCPGRESNPHDLTVKGF